MQGFEQISSNFPDRTVALLFQCIPSCIETALINVF